MTAPTSTDSGGRYWAVTDKQTGEIAFDHCCRVAVLCDEDMAKEARFPDSFEMLEVAIIPASTYTRLLAIEAAARNAHYAMMRVLDSAADGDPDCYECRGGPVVSEADVKAMEQAHDALGTVLDPKDAKELKEALATPAVSGEHTKGKTDED